jgi:DedD protein
LDEGLKKRLVGAAVLASLAVIFVPMLVEEPGDHEPAIDKIPAPPQQPAFSSNLLREEVVAPQPLPPEPVVAPLPAESEPPSSAEAVPPTDTGVAEPEPSTRTGLTAWMVQVGSFSNRENAAQLVEKLRKAGYQTPDADRVEIRGKTLFRVRVGPMVDKDKAQSLLPKINEISGTKGMVSRFQ